MIRRSFSTTTPTQPNSPLGPTAATAHPSRQTGLNLQAAGQVGHGRPIPHVPNYSTSARTVSPTVLPRSIPATVKARSSTLLPNLPIHSATAGVITIRSHGGRRGTVKHTTVVPAPQSFVPGIMAMVRQ